VGLWRRSAARSARPALYYKTLRPSIKVRRGRFVDLNISVVPSPPGQAPRRIDDDSPQDIDMAEGASTSARR